MVDEHLQIENRKTGLGSIVKTSRSNVKSLVGTVLSQGIILILAAVTGFVLPKAMGVEAYGYWQAYLFYLTYLPLFGLGFNDGLTLLYGGRDQSQLPLPKIRSAVRVVILVLAVVAIAGFALSSFFLEGEYSVVFGLLSLSIPLVALQCILLSLFLAVGRTQLYNIVNVIAKAFAVVFYLALIFASCTSSEAMMAVDFFARLLVTLLCLAIGWSFVVGPADDLRAGLAELSEKVRAGLKITVAILCSMFIPVCGRMIIEWSEPIAVYGVYSFAMTLLTIIMAFTNAAGTVVFPMMKRVDESALLARYKDLAFLTSVIVAVSLIFYAPLCMVVRYYLTDYVGALPYLHVLLVMCIPLGKAQLVLTPFYKVFRMEGSFLVLNVIGALGMLGCTFAAYSLFRSVVAVAVSSAVVLYAWVFCLEAFFARKRSLSLEVRNILIDVAMGFAFVIAGQTQDVLWFTALYVAVVLALCAVERKRLLRFVERARPKRS